MSETELLPTVESLDDVPEALRDFYKEQDDGRFHLPLKGVETAESVAGLKSALEKEKEARRLAREQLSKLPEDLDDRMARLKELEDAEAERQIKKAEQKGEWDKLAEQLKGSHQKVVEEKDTTIKGLEAQIDDYLRKNAAVTALGEAKAAVEIGLPHVLARTKIVVGEDGQRRAVVVDEKGETRLSPSGTGEYMTITELVKEMGEQDKWAPIFLEPGATGGGAKGRRSAGGGRNKPLKEMTESEKADFIDENGLDAWNDLVMKTYKP